MAGDPFEKATATHHADEPGCSDAVKPPDEDEEEDVGAGVAEETGGDVAATVGEAVAAGGGDVGEEVAEGVEEEDELPLALKPVSITENWVRDVTMLVSVTT